MTHGERKAKLLTDLDHARAQANVWAQSVIGISAQLQLVEDMLKDEQFPNESDILAS